MRTKYAIKSTKTGKTYYRLNGCIHDWCMEGEGELKFDSQTAAIIYALHQNITDYEVVPVN